MIRHCVFVRFRSEFDDTAIADLLGELADVCAPLDGVVAVHVGPNVSPEVEVSRGFRHGFVIDFDTVADRDAYLVDPGHQAFGSRLVAAAVAGTNGIMVFDLEIV